MTTDVHLLNSGLSEDGDEIIAIGFLDIKGMSELLVADYQREVLHKLTSGRRSSLDRAIYNGKRLPSIVVGMRGSNFTSGKHDTMILHDKCYIVDGLQRVSALKEYAELNPDKAAGLRIGVEVRFGTTKESEAELFHVLNTARTSMSPNIILRNLRHKNRAILTLYGLSMSDTSSPIYKRVQWQQRMSRGELITATGLCNVARILHGYGSRSGAGGLAGATATMETAADSIGLDAFRKNVETFYGLLDTVYGMGKIQFTQRATVTKLNFMAVLARMFAEHANFWDGDKLVVDSDMRRKLGTFPMDDFEVMRLASSGGMSQPTLYNLLRDHINKGRRSDNKLVPRSIEELPRVKAKKKT
jgi:hypothetical protein